MFKKKIKVGAQFLALAVFVSLVLAACGGGNQSSGQTVDQQTDGNNGSAEQGTSAGADGDELVTLSIWGWDENYVSGMFEEFNRYFPHITYELTTVDAGDYLQRLQTTVAVGGELPDILWAEVAFRGRALSIDIWENLEAEPFNLDRDLMFDFVHPVVSNPRGEIVAIEQGVNPAVLAYRRDLTTEFFGTDDPDELSAMFSDFDSLIRLGQEVHEQSGGTVYAFASLGDVGEMLLYQNTTPLMDGDVLDITRRMSDYLEMIVRFRDAGIVDRLSMWSPQWNASFSEGRHMFYPAASWSPEFIINPNDPDGVNTWGLMVPPGGAFSWGGTALGISNTSENKEAAWEFLRWSTLTEEGGLAARDRAGVFIPLISMYDDPAFASLTFPQFGDLDVGAFWFEQAIPKVVSVPLTPFDLVVREVNLLVLDSLNSDSSMTAADALEMFIQEASNRLPEEQVR